MSSNFISKISTPKTAILCAMCIALVLSVIKLLIGFLSGSVAIIASGLDSLLDVGISLFNFFMLGASERPANHKFHYGLGKLESLSSSIEGFIIALSGLYVLYISIVKIYQGSMIENLDSGIYVMVFSCAMTFGLVSFLSIINKKSNSLILKADILHYKTDLLTNIAILVALLIVQISDFYIIDGILGILISLYILTQSYKLIKEGIMLLLDRAISDENQQKIELILRDSKITSYHALRTRQVGNVIFVDVHLVFDEFISLNDAHLIAQDIEKRIREIDNSFFWDVITHLDPEDDYLLEIQSKKNINL